MWLVSVVLTWMPTAANIAADAILRSFRGRNLPVWTGGVQNKYGHLQLHVVLTKLHVHRSGDRQTENKPAGSN